MHSQASPTVVHVRYRGARHDRFDRHYYVDVHLPLVMAAWGRYGLLGLEAFFPASGSEGTVALCECIFRDDAALDAAFASPEAARVMADVPRFTAIAPTRFRLLPL
ncbi:EthD family reductase [Coralloluteibacterium stylophorae]|uniref:EthD family reductase n=1 Tax=Coralloluteibacterium stylophorae TaxID=1776034 RepID=A0A8J8AWK3_9GAMM|nr:EthD family reductase [Coralloluteibacterium stylophorae]MBS7457163.1 EthD family reductase [Coralloluteibacterium stylophorae]